MIKNKSRFSFIILPIFILLAVLCAFSLRAPVSISARAETTSLSGAGTAENPKIIASVDDFLFFVNSVNDVEASEDYLTYNYKLIDDLDLSAIEYVSIGTEARPFNGTFNGNGRILSGVTIDVAGAVNNVGLFGVLGANANVNSLGVYNARIIAYNSANVGGISGYNEGTIEGCFYYGNINAKQNVGGIAGVNKGTISQSFSNGSLIASASESNLGGLVGQNHKTLQYSYSLAVISTNNANPMNFGGIIGGRYTSEIESTPTGTFYNISANPGINAVGFGSASLDNSAVELKPDRTQALTRTEFNTATLQKLFTGNLNWVRDTFKVSNHSSYVAPIQKVFADRIVGNEGISALKVKLESACSERMYGINAISTDEWGSENNPYLIENETQLRNLQRAVTDNGESYFEKHFYQSIENLSLSSKFYPIGNRALNNVFQGTYDGGNNTISNMKIEETSSDTDYLGMFGYIGESATICNLTLDESCEVSGLQYVGSLVGYNNAGTIKNVESRANVSARGKTGGVVGLTRGGKFYDVLSAVTLSLRGNINEGLYGIIGAYQNSEPVAENVWYFVNASNGFKSTNGIGKVLVVDSTNGNVVAEKKSNGDIIFTKEIADDNFSLEFRNEVEFVYYKGDSFEQLHYDDLVKPNKYSDVIYARFVKNITISLLGASDNYVGATTLTDAFGNETNYLYNGQKFTLAIKVLDGAYLNKVELKDKYDTSITDLTSSYSYNGSISSVEYNATMQTIVDEVEVDVQPINWKSIDDIEGIEDSRWQNLTFNAVFTYDSEEYAFPTEYLLAPDNYSLIVNYSSGSAPVKANQSVTENYSFTVVYQNQNDIRMGSKTGTIHINKSQLYIPLTSLNEESKVVYHVQNEKQWDDSELPTSAWVDNSVVYYNNDTSFLVSATGDNVQVNATMKFFNNTVVYDSEGNYVPTKIDYEFTLTGTDANNYIAPSNASGSGRIIRRQIIVSLDSYEGIFAGVGKKPSLSGKKTIVSGAIARIPYEPNFDFLSDTGADISEISTYGSVGTYRLVPIISGDAANYYDVTIKDALLSEDGAYSYVYYTVLPYQANLNYLVDGEAKDVFTYNGEEREVGCYFMDVNGNRINVNSFNLSDYEGNKVEKILNAGTYVIKATYTDNNYDISNSSEKTIVIEKAEQESLEFTSSATHDFGTSYTASVIGGSGIGSVVFSVSEQCTDMASFDGNILTIRKAGEITIIATKRDNSGNYNDAVQEFVLTVNKTELEIGIIDFEIDYLDIPIFEFVSSTGAVVTGVEGVTIMLNGSEYDGEILDVDVYDISIAISSEAVSDGYILTAGQCGTLTVNTLAIMVTADNKTSVYGEKLQDLTYVVSDSRVKQLVGALETNARNVGDSDILAGTINNDNNPNYDITFVNGTYTIKEKELIVKAIAQEKLYGETDPAPKYDVVGLAYDDTESSIGLNVKIARLSGEDSYLENVDTYGTYKYRLSEEITMNSNNYMVIFETATLTIIPGTPELVSKSVVNVLPGVSLDSSNIPSMQVSGRVYENNTWNTQNLTGSVRWKKSETPDFSDSAVLNYIAVFIPENKNYGALEVSIEVKVVPIEVSVRFTSSKQIVYDGNEHDNVQYELVGLIDGIKAKEKISYEGDVKNVGSFTAKVTINNYNYKLAGSGEVTIKISKASLEVMVKDIEILEGETPKIEYLYSGFQKGDTEEVLTKEPSVELPTTPGLYTLTPSGAKGDNYTISYKSFTFKVLSKMVIDKDNNLKVEGKFDSETKFELLEGKTDSEMNDKYAEVQEGYKALENMGIDKVYDLKYSIGDEAIVAEGEIYLTMAVPEGYEESKLAYAILTNDGEIVYVQDILYDGDLVRINVTNAKSLLLLTEQEDNSYMLYIAIGAGVLVIVIIALIIRSVKKRREARYIKYED